MATAESSLHKNFTLRGESYKAGMLLLVKHLTEQDWKRGNQFLAQLDLISNKIETLYKDYVHDLLNDEKMVPFEMENIYFQKLIASYISILGDHTTLKDPFQSLCDAEHYAVLLKGRKSFETPVTFPIREDDNNPPKILKISLSEKPINDQKLLFPEYSNNNVFWFQFLEAWEQNVIQKITKELQGQNVFSIPSSLRSIPGLANASVHECKIDNRLAVSYFRHATQLPIDLLGKKGTENEQFRLTCLNLASQIRQSIEKIKTQGESEFPGEVVILTQSLVSPGKVANLKAKFISVPSDNDTLIYEFKEKAVRLFQNALANPDVLIRDDKIKSLFFTPEEREQKEDQLYYKDFLEKWGLIAQDNKTFKYENQKPITITLLSTNHPLNVLRHLEAYAFQNESNEYNAALLLGSVARYLRFTLLNIKKKKQESQLKWQNETIYLILNRQFLLERLNKLIEVLNFCENEKKIIRYQESIIKIIKDLLSENIETFLDENTLQLLHAIQSLLSIPSGQGILSTDERHKPQLRSFAEIMIVNCLKGAAWVACKSGKDRTGGSSISTDAAAIYYHQNKKFPCYQDSQSEREGYLKIAKELYKSGHQQQAASENAPGANGLIKPNWFFPSDFKLDKKEVQLETQLARLNKPKTEKKLKKELLNNQILNKNLKGLRDKTINFTLGESAILLDWKRNWESYFINGKNVKELRENKEFEDENDLSEFMETHLLTQIENTDLKKYYKSLVLYSFHQGGFPHSFSQINSELINQYYQQQEQSFILAQPDMQINFSWSEEYQCIQIEEINTYEGKKDYASNNDDVIRPEKGDYYCQTQSCILLNLSEAKDNSYKLAVNIQSAGVDCADELKSIFFTKRLNLLEVFVRYIQSLLDGIKCYFDGLIESGPVLNESWLSRTNSALFKKPIVSTSYEEKVIQTQLQDATLPGFSNHNRR